MLKQRVLFVLGVLALIGIGAAYGVEVALPSRARAKATVVVDSLGQVLFGSTPARVELVNLPDSSNIADEAWSVVSAGPVIETVPLDKALLITDISAATNNQSGTMALSDSTGTRLVWDQFSPKRFSFTTGLLFGPGESVTYTFNGGGAPTATFMGRMIAIP